MKSFHSTCVNRGVFGSTDVNRRQPAKHIKIHVHETWNQVASPGSAFTSSLIAKLYDVNIDIDINFLAH